MGIKNAIVTNEDSSHLAELFPQYFDRIMVDAPCSGEGMFRKNEEAQLEWSLENVALCASRQDEILDNAASMLCPGGRIVYSTCTFAPEENEGSIARFLTRHPDFSIKKAKKYPGMSEGHPEWTSTESMELRNTLRLWPHLLKGEGHFVAILEKSGSRPAIEARMPRFGLEKGISLKSCKEYVDFKETYLTLNLPGNLVKFGEQLYLLPLNAPSLKGLRVLRPGLHLGTFLKNRFEPSHALALALRPADVKLHTNLSSTDSTVLNYINGQTFSTEGEKGWHLITINQYSLGWGKLVNGTMKNHYPKGLRKKLYQ